MTDLTKLPLSALLQSMRVMANGQVTIAIGDAEEIDRREREWSKVAPAQEPFDHDAWLRSLVANDPIEVLAGPAKDDRWVRVFFDRLTDTAVFFLYESGDEGFRQRRPDHVRPLPSAPPVDVEAPHSDDIAVDRFAAAMKAKLATKRAEGRSGWETCGIEDLAEMLVDHVPKGDVVDIANFCMFVFHVENDPAHVANAYESFLSGSRLSALKRELAEAKRLCTEAQRIASDANCAAKIATEHAQLTMLLTAAERRAEKAEQERDALKRELAEAKRDYDGAILARDAAFVERDAAIAERTRLHERIAVRDADIGVLIARAEEAEALAASRPEISAMSYGQGYAAGHNDTVEGVYVDVMHRERGTYFAELAAAIVEDFDRAHANHALLRAEKAERERDEAVARAERAATKDDEGCSRANELCAIDRIMEALGLPLTMDTFTEDADAIIAAINAIKAEACGKSLWSARIDSAREMLRRIEAELGLEPHSMWPTAGDAIVAAIEALRNAKRATEDEMVTRLGAHGHALASILDACGISIDKNESPHDDARDVIAAIARLRSEAGSEVDRRIVKAIRDRLANGKPWKRAEDLAIGAGSYQTVQMWFEIAKALESEANEALASEEGS